MKIAISLKPQSYTPEAYAYQKFFSDKGHEVVFVSPDQNLENFDISIFFMGIKTYPQRSEKTIEIHEYQSLSTPPFSNVKDFIKKNFNQKPQGRIFLNNVVREKLNFSDSIPYIFRDMGVDSDLFLPTPKMPTYDLVYCGSVRGRIGLISQILRLAALGLKIVVIGDLDRETEEIFKQAKNITTTGRLSRHEIPEIYKLARAGLNFTPDIFPFNIQTSTKTLEYLAAGLGLVSNKYYWSVEFAKRMDIIPLWLHELDSAETFYQKVFEFPDMTQFDWRNVLENSGIERFFLGLVR